MRKNFTSAVAEHWNRLPMGIVESPSLPGHYPVQSALGCPCLGRGLAWMMSTGPFQRKPFCDSSFFLAKTHFSFPGKCMVPV